MNEQLDLFQWAENRPRALVIPIRALRLARKVNGIPLPQSRPQGEPSVVPLKAPVSPEPERLMA